MAPNRPKVSVSLTGKFAERVETLPITSRAGEKPKIVLRLGPKEAALSPLPDLRPGDELKALVELAVTTDCREVRQGDCVKRPYTYSPRVRARLLLADNASGKNRGQGRVIPLAQEVATVSQDQHHHVFVLEAQVSIPRDWKARRRYFVIVSLDASNRRAKPQQVLLIGANEKGGVRQDMARISVARLRPGDERAPSAEISKQLRVTQLPLTKEKRVVLSQPVAGLASDEQLVVGAMVESSARALPYKARISGRLVLADSPAATDAGREARQVDALGEGEIAEHNGSNCLAGATHRTRKVGVLQVSKKAKRTHYVNLVCESADPVQGRRDKALALTRGSLAVTRYPADWKG